MLKFLNLFFRDLCRVFARSLIYVFLTIFASFITGYLWSNECASRFTVENAYVLNALRYASVGVWAILFMFAAAMVVVVSCQWFGEDMLTNRSYLNHMLPVYTWEPVLSKALAGIVVMAAAVGIMSLNLIDVADDISIVKDLLGIIPDLAQSDGLDFDLAEFIKLGIYFMFMLCLFVMSAAFISLSLGQLFSRGISRNFLIFIAFFAVLFISMFVLIAVFKTSGVTLSTDVINSIQSVFDMAKKILSCISNTNLVLSVIMLTGTSLILTYRLNV